MQPGQVEALKYVQELAGSRKLRFDITLQPGQPLLVAPDIVDRRKMEEIWNKRGKLRHSDSALVARPRAAPLRATAMLKNP